MRYEQAKATAPKQLPYDKEATVGIEAGCKGIVNIFPQRFRDSLGRL